MVRGLVFVLALMIPVPSSLAEQTRGARDTGKPGTMSVAELRKEPVTFELDVPYADDGNPRHRLDLYLPKKRAVPKLPVIVFFHGGGWSQGDKSDGAGRLIPYLRTGEYAGVSAGYRLSGEAQWPAQIHDAKAAIRWVRANAAKYGLDPNHIGIWGRNAGGHIALMLGVTSDVAELEGDVGPHKSVSCKVHAVANFFGIADIMALAGRRDGINRSRPNPPEAMLIGGPLEENGANARAASPVAYVTSDDAPVLTVHGTADRTVPYDQAVRMDAALRKAAVPSYFVTVKGGGHGDFDIAADDRVLALFDRYLREKKVMISLETIEWPMR